ncbi:MAG: phosphate ABC transporter substrate-binding protein PstS [Moorellales bacterium]
MLTAVLLLACVVGCGRPVPPSQLGAQPGTTGRVKLSGGGATFPYPLYSKWIEEYKKLKPGVLVDYQSIGSGGGIRGITEGTLDFAGSDAPMTPEERAKAPAEIVHLPVVLGAVAVTYNLPGNPVLNLDGETLAEIYLGRITKWNHPRLQALNPGLTLPERDIAVIHRSDGSGTTFVFTDYLSRTSPAWREGPGTGKSVSWPFGIGGKGNEGVTGQLKLIEGAIGYVELAYAVKNGLPCARMKNRAGRFVAPTPAAVAAAAAGAAQDMPEDLCLSLVNAPGPDAYPISTFSYLLVYQDQPDPVKGKALAEFLWWAVHEGQQYAEELLYAPLPEPVVKRLEEKLKDLTSQGRPLLP